MDFLNNLINACMDFVLSMGIFSLGIKNIIMILISFVLMYLAIGKKYEPLLLIPIAFGMFLANLPLTGLMNEPTSTSPGGLLYYISLGNTYTIFPPLIFLGIGALTDFGPLIANPKSLILGGAAQVGIFFTFIFSMMLGFTVYEAASISIIGGADGPTAIMLSNILAPNLQGAIAIAAYSYMALVPIIQPPIMRGLTTKAERSIKMEQLRDVSKREKIIFPILVATTVILIIPASAPLIGMLMLGNLLRESAVTDQLAKAVSEYLMYIVTIFIGIGVGAKTSGDVFLTWATIKIILLGLIAFALATACGVLLGKLMCKLTGGKVNPLIGAAGVSAVPMAARVVQKVGAKEDPENFLLMHAMGPNVAGVIGSAIVAGIFLSMFA